MAKTLNKLMDAQVLLAIGLLLAFISGAYIVGPAVASIVTPVVVSIGKLIIVIAAVLVLAQKLGK